MIGELEKYNPELLDKKRMLAVTKSDMLDLELMDDIKKEMNLDCEWMFISSVAQTGITELKDAIWKNIG